MEEELESAQRRMDRVDARAQTAAALDRDERAAERAQASSAKRVAAAQAREIRKADRLTRASVARSPPKERVRPRYSEDAPATGAEMHRGAKAGKSKTATAQAARERCAPGHHCTGMWNGVAKSLALVGAHHVMRGMWLLILCGLTIGRVEGESSVRRGDADLADLKSGGTLNASPMKLKVNTWRSTHGLTGRGRMYTCWHAPSRREELSRLHVVRRQLSDWAGCSGQNEDLSRDIED